MAFSFLNDLMVIFYLCVGGSIVSLVIYIIAALCNLGSKGSGTSHRSYSTMESEMRAYNSRVEQLLQEQHRTMIENESRRISESINRPLSEQFDTRLTNIFRNPWDGIL